MIFNVNKKITRRWCGQHILLAYIPRPIRAQMTRNKLSPLSHCSRTVSFRMYIHTCRHGVTRLLAAPVKRTHAWTPKRTWVFWIFNSEAHCGMHTLFQHTLAERNSRVLVDTPSRTVDISLREDTRKRFLEFERERHCLCWLQMNT